MLKFVVGTIVGAGLGWLGGVATAGYGILKMQEREGGLLRLEQEAQRQLDARPSRVNVDITPRERNLEDEIKNWLDSDRNR